MLVVVVAVAVAVAAAAAVLVVFVSLHENFIIRLVVLVLWYHFWRFCTQKILD